MSLLMFRSNNSGLLFREAVDEEEDVKMSRSVNQNDEKPPPNRHIPLLPPINTFPPGLLLPPLAFTRGVPPTARRSLMHPSQTLPLPRLPPMETHPSLSTPLPVQQQQQQHSVAQPQYYASHGQPHPSSMNAQSSSPPTDYSTSAAARQQKKDIKRRTKTGCLTCRARRIKCDETRPLCRNCAKSKRECAGYDPIFRASPHSSLQSPPSSMQAGQQFSDFTSIDPALDPSGNSRLLPGEYDPTQQAYMTAPPLNIEDILNVGSGLPPPPISSPTSLEGSDRETVAHLYEHLYGPAVDKFFESRWFINRGLNHLLNNAPLLEKFKVLKSRFIYTPSNNMHEFLITQSLEASLIWDIMLLARQVSLSITTTNDPAANSEIAEGVHDVARRIDTFEALITNQQLNPSNAPTEPPRSGATTPAGKPALQPQLQFREQNFWYLVSRFCVLRDDSKSYNENPVEEIDKSLQEMRLLLDSRENRDILYSIAIIRHVGHKLVERAAQSGGNLTINRPVGNDEDDPVTKVSVARRFVQEEANGKGTNQVTQRVCGMVVMAWTKR